jgi:Xaa-Pro aminopeptidase
VTQEPIDRTRAQRLMAAADLDALVLFQPEHVATATGTNPGVAALFRRAGAASALVPADPAQRIAAVMPDLMAGAVRLAGAPVDVAFHPIWVDTARVGPHGEDDPLSAVLGPGEHVTRPATFDPRAAFALLAGQLKRLGLARARLGLDLGFVPVADFELLKAALPGATLLDGTDALRRLRMVKTAAEIARLRAAAELGEAGYARALAAVRPAVERAELSVAYADGVRAAAAERGVAVGGHWDYISIGPDPWGPGRPARAGDILKFDVGVVIGGYSSDFARTVCLGTPSRAARDLHAALLAGLQAGLAALKPGVRLAAIHAVMLDTVRRAGAAAYARGHFGHGLGNDPFSEQWPFIAGDCDVLAEPGMVLAVEAPHYVEGLGGFIVEDQVLVTAEGIEIMTTSPRDLLQL